MPAAERDHGGFLFNFPLDIGGEGGRERRREVEYLSSAREKKVETRDGERERDREKGGSKDRCASRVTGIRDAATEAAFGNSDDVRGDSCFEMSAANSSALQLGWRVFLRFSSPAVFVLT